MSSKSTWRWRVGRREVADLEAKLFEENKRGCLAVMIGPRKLGEIDYERYEGGDTRMKIGLKGAPLPEGTSNVTVFINDQAVADLVVERGSGYLRLDSARGDSIPEINVKDTAAMRVGDATVCSGTFHKD